MPTTSEKSMFLSVLELSTPVERERYLKQVSDPALCAGVEELLSAHQRDNHPLDEPLQDVDNARRRWEAARQDGAGHESGGG